MAKIKSPAFKIDTKGLVKVGKGALIAGGAVALTYLAENLGSVDFGGYTALVVGITGIVINFLRKLIVSYE